MGYYEKMNELFEKHRGKVVTTSDYVGVIAGFHYKWFDEDSEQFIIAITKNISPVPKGYWSYRKGDVLRTHKENLQNDMKFDYLHLWQLKDMGWKL